jgi:NAD(P)-dependent dehydrogenase (short-subunit alcohol dehydrogenase family)
MLIGTGSLTRQSLAGQVAVVTGAGGGIGFEAARALVWLGAHVVIAEINRPAGREAAARLMEEWDTDTVTFVHTDVGDQHSVNRLSRQILHSLGKVDIVLNNATIAPLGAVKDVSIKDWDASYRVNLRGPVLLAQAFLPGMLARDYGVFVCVSSYALKYVGAYEILKKTQVELANTLDAELEGTGVIAFTIGPGLVLTETARFSIERLAPLYGKTVDEFYAMLKEHIISVEAAGAGFAAAIALAARYRGQEIGSIMALQAAGIELPKEEAEVKQAALTREELEQVLTLCRKVRTTLAEQSERWKKRSLFEGQWIIRDFKKHAGMPVEQWLDTLERLERYAEGQNLAGLADTPAPIGALVSYYAHLQELANISLKDPVQLAEQLQIVRGWQEEAEKLERLLGKRG